MDRRTTGHVIHLTGISGSGKTTLGNRLKHILEKRKGRPVEFIDGDSARGFLEATSGFSLEERHVVTKQIAYAAHLLSENGIDVVVANIAGTYGIRDYLRRKLKRYVQVFLDADVEDCIKHDVKGVYKRGEESMRPDIYGLDIPYERPRQPDVIVYPYRESIIESMTRITRYLEETAFLKTDGVTYAK
jgi:adenylylsulfate kinase-like enzyme